MTDFKVRWLNANSDTLGLLHCRHGNHSCVADVGRLGFLRTKILNLATATGLAITGESYRQIAFVQTKHYAI